MTDPQKQEGDDSNNNGNNNQVEMDHEVEEDKISVNPLNEEMVSEWVACDPIDTDLLGTVDASAIFDHVLPSLADFPTVPSPSQSSSSSSSSSSISSSACSSSCSSSPWSIIKKEKNDSSARQSGERPADYLAAGSLAAQSTATIAAACSPPMLLVSKQEPMDTVLDGFGEMGILDTVDISWETSMFQTDVNTNSSLEDENCFVGSPPTIHDNQNEGQENDNSSSQELAQVFFDWLRSNKESISPEDLRSIKLKKSTIESAVNRLGGGKNGMLQLLKLILTWVQNHHLQKKQKQYSPYCDDTSNMPCYYQQQQHQGFGWPNSNSWCLPIAAIPIGQSPVYDPCMSSFPTAVGCPSVDMGYAFASEPVQALPLSASPPAPCGNLVDAGSWPQAHPFYPDDASLMSFPPRSSSSTNYNSIVQQTGCMSKSATKEARKKRMARQRRFLFHHSHSNVAEKAMVMEFHGSNVNNQSNCMVWSSSPPVNPSPEGQQRFHQLAPVDKRQGLKTEKNLRFLLRKVLKQSDVGKLGRIVLPKKEAEMYLPELEFRDGISIAMEDVGTSRVWNMRYRFWPNNKSRMYLLENTGDFVRSNGLQEGDFIVIYSDVKSGKYLIRGVKVPCQGADKAQMKVQKTITRKPLKPTAMDVSSSSNAGPVSS